MDGLAKIHRYYDDLLAFDPSSQNHRSHRVFLEKAITICYNSNQSEAARSLYDHYTENNYSGNKNQTYEQFILGSMTNTMKRNNSKASLAIIEAILKNSFTAARSQNYELSQGLRNRAFLYWRIYHKKFKGTASALPNIREIEQRAKATYAGGNSERKFDLEQAMEKALKTKRPKIAIE